MPSIIVYAFLVTLCVLQYVSTTKRTEGPARITVNKMILQFNKTSSGDYNTMYYYTEGENVDVFCSSKNESLTLIYENRGETFDLIEYFSYGVGLTVKLLCKHDNSSMTCKLIDDDSKNTVYKVKFIMKREIVKDVINVKINDLVLRTQPYQLRRSTRRIRYEYIVHEIMNIHFDINENKAETIQLNTLNKKYINIVKGPITTDKNIDLQIYLPYENNEMDFKMSCNAQKKNEGLQVTTTIVIVQIYFLQSFLTSDPHKFKIDGLDENKIKLSLYSVQPVKKIIYYEFDDGEELNLYETCTKKKLKLSPDDNGRSIICTMQTYANITVTIILKTTTILPTTLTTIAPTTITSIVDFKKNDMGPGPNPGTVTEPGTVPDASPGTEPVATWVPIVVVVLVVVVIIVLVSIFVCRVKRRKQRITGTFVSKSNEDYENLRKQTSTELIPQYPPQCDDGYQNLEALRDDVAIYSAPHKEDTYAKPIPKNHRAHTECTAPEDMYTKPLPKSQRISTIKGEKSQDMNYEPIPKKQRENENNYASIEASSERHSKLRDADDHDLNYLEITHYNNVPPKVDNDVEHYSYIKSKDDGDSKYSNIKANIQSDAKQYSNILPRINIEPKIVDSGDHNGYVKPKIVSSDDHYSNVKPKIGGSKTIYDNINNRSKYLNIYNTENVEPTYCEPNIVLDKK